MIRSLILLIIIVAIILVIVFSKEVKQGLTDFIQWIADHKVSGPLILSLVYIAATIFFIPGSILTLGAGYAFNLAYKSTGIALLIGTLSVWLGAAIGSLIAFLLARYVFTDQVAKLSQKFRLFRAIDKAMLTEGLKVTFLLRLTPLIPYNVFNYIMGLTKVTTLSYFLASFGMLPGTIVYVFIGTTIANI